MRCNEATKNMMSLLGGLGIGAAVMYLFDPKEGPKRRGNIAHSAEDAWEAIRDKAGGYGTASTAGLTALGAAMGKKTGDWSKQMQNYRKQYQKRAMGMTGDASHMMDDWMNWGRGKMLAGRERLSRHREEEHGGSMIGQTIAAVGFVALGVGLAYIIDPAVGRRRRAVVRDKVMSGMHQGQDYLSKTGKHLWNKASGTVAEARSRLHREMIGDEVLVDRVRAQMGRCVSSPASVIVRADEGKVTVSGPILATEVDDFLKCVWQTRGVKEIINELTPQEQMA